jgi:hypothetical protein
MSNCSISIETYVSDMELDSYSTSSDSELDLSSASSSASDYDSDCDPKTINATDKVEFATPKPLNLGVISGVMICDNLYFDAQKSRFELGFAQISDSDEDDWDYDQENAGTRCEVKRDMDLTKFFVGEDEKMKFYVFDVNGALYVLSSRYEWRYYKVQYVEITSKGSIDMKVKKISYDGHHEFLGWLKIGEEELDSEDEVPTQSEGWLSPNEVKKLHTQPMVRSAEIFIHDRFLHMEFTWDREYDITFKSVAALEEFLIGLDVSKFFKRGNKVFTDFSGIKLDDEKECYWCINLYKSDFKREYRNGWSFYKALKESDGYRIPQIAGGP